MSTPHRHNPPLEVRERAACMCDHGDVCSSFAPGHALHLIQARLASATPSDWADAIVESADAATGVIFVRTPRRRRADRPVERRRRGSRRSPRAHRSRCTSATTCSLSGASVSTS